MAQIQDLNHEFNAGRVSLLDPSTGATTCAALRNKTGAFCGQGFFGLWPLRTKTDFFMPRIFRAATFQNKNGAFCGQDFVRTQNGVFDCWSGVAGWLAVCTYTGVRVLSVVSAKPATVSPFE